MKEIIYHRKICIGIDRESKSNVFLELEINETDLSKEKIYNNKGELIRTGSFKETINHNRIQNYTTLSISGYSKDYCGQIQNMLTNKNIEFNLKYNVERIVEIWNKWHLNDLQAGCIHMEEPVKGKEWDEKEWERLNKMCPLNYKYGSKWLVKNIPLEIITEIKNLFAGKF